MDKFLKTVFSKVDSFKRETTPKVEREVTPTQNYLSLEVKFAYIFKEIDYFGSFYNAKLVYLSFKII